MPLNVNDPTFAATIASTETPVQVVRADGSVLGVFLPATPGMSIPESGMTDAELRCLINNPNGWVSADAVDARLRELEGSA